MAKKLGRRQFPPGYSPSDFTYEGRPSKDQNDFGSEVGIVDMACVNQFGEANNAKYYHAGVVKTSTGAWFVYLEWGRISGGKSWNGSFSGGDYMFVECTDETDARKFFEKQCKSKNVRRLVQKQIGGKAIWAAKPGKDGYIVQSLAARERGLPDAYGIKDSTGIQVSTPSDSGKKAKTSPPKQTKTHQPQVISLANSLVGGTKDYARAATQATGIIPTMEAIEEVRNELIPLALKRIQVIGGDVSIQIQDQQMIDLSRLVASMVPRPIPRTASADVRAKATILSADNILAIQNDLDAFESALKNEDFEVEVTTSQPDPCDRLGATVVWLDRNTTKGRWVESTFRGMSNRRHSYLSREPKIINIFEITRPKQDAAFMQAVTAVGNKRKGSFSLKANLQPIGGRQDVQSMKESYRLANVIFTQHGTRSVNVLPIIQTHFRLPRSLRGVVITGANFGHGCYYSTDFRKAAGYTSLRGSYWSSGSGNVSGRGAFMFLCDMIMGDAYRAPRTGSWTSPPNGKDSVFGVGGDRGHRLQNDEHVIFDPNYSRIRYLVEFDF